MDAETWKTLEGRIDQMLALVRNLRARIAVLESEAGGLRRELETNTGEIRLLQDRLARLAEERRVIRTKVAAVLRSLSRWSLP